MATVTKVTTPRSDETSPETASDPDAPNEEQAPASAKTEQEKGTRDRSGDTKKKPPRRFPPMLIILIVATLAVILSPLATMGNEPVGTEASYSEIIETLDAGNVAEATISNSNLKVTVKDDTGTETWAYYPLGASETLSDKILAKDIPLTVEPVSTPNLLSTALITLLPVALIITFLFFLMRRGGGAGGLAGLKLGKKTTPVEVPPTRFSDVAGVDEAVEELQEVVDFLHHPERFTQTGGKVPRGFLLVGPPGTGKTLLARAVAGEAGVPFFAITGSDFVEMFVGLGASRVRELFAKARSQEKAIIFIDEIDAVGKARGRGPATGANDERENTLNQLLVEMDGFAESKGIVMIAATNRADVLDPALLRPGRFDRKIMVPPPDRAGREKLLALYSSTRPFADDIDWAGLARRIPGMTGAEIEQMLNEAALEAARRNESTISNEHLQSALATSVLGRERRSAVITDRDREIVAWHEAGHTIAALLQEDTDDPVTCTIVPRGAAGGVTWLGGSEHDFMTRKQAEAQLVVSMGGRAAEEILLDGDHTQGAHGDLQSATRLATDMIARFGMGDRLVALDVDKLAYTQTEDLDREISFKLEAALTTARHLLNRRRELLRKTAEALLEQETLTIEEIRAIADQDDAERNELELSALEEDISTGVATREPAPTRTAGLH